MTPFSSVAMLEKLALLKIALCNAPALSSASSARLRGVASSIPGDDPLTEGSMTAGKTTDRVRDIVHALANKKADATEHQRCSIASAYSLTGLPASAELPF